MMRRNTAAAFVIPAPAADPDYISDSGSSTSVPPPKPGRKQTNSVLQVLRAGGAPVVPTLEVGQPSAVEEMTSQVVEGGARAAGVGTAINNNQRAYARIPMTRSEGPSLDASHPPPPRDRPVICAYCNCAFCFGEDEVPSLNPGHPGQVYPAPSVPITLNLLTPPPVEPLYRDDRELRAMPPALLLVCSSEQHFKATMGMLLQLPGGGAPSLLVWKRTCCLRVQPIVVGSEGASSSDLHAIRAPPPEPWRYAGAYWNYVQPGHEDLVKLHLHDDPLKLTLGRR